MTLLALFDADPLGVPSATGWIVGTFATALLGAMVKILFVLLDRMKEDRVAHDLLIERKDKACADERIACTESYERRADARDSLQKASNEALIRVLMLLEKKL